MNKKKIIAWVASVLAVGVCCVGGIVLLDYYFEQVRIREIDATLRELAQALKEHDYAKAKQYCTTDFRLDNERPEDNHDLTDAKLEEIASDIIGLADAGPSKFPPNLWLSSFDGTYRYMPYDSGSFPFPNGMFYEFRRENGKWKFTGVVAWMVD